MPVSEEEQIADAIAAQDRDRLRNIISMQQARIEGFAEMIDVHRLSVVVTDQQAILDKLRGEKR